MEIKERDKVAVKGLTELLDKMEIKLNGRAEIIASARIVEWVYDIKKRIEESLEKPPEKKQSEEKLQKKKKFKKEK